MRIITLHKVPREQVMSSYQDTDDVGENLQASAPQPTPVGVNVDTIRCFTPRRDNKPGTRITFNDGGGFPVTESFEEVSQMVQPN